MNRERKNKSLFPGSDFVTSLFFFFFFACFLVAFPVPVATQEQPPPGNEAQLAPVVSDGWDSEEWESEDWDDTPPDAPPEQIYDYERCLALALAQNREIRAADWELKVAHGQKREGWWSWWPRIKIQFAVSPSPDYDAPSLDDADAFLQYEKSEYNPGIHGATLATKVSVVQPLYTFGKYSAAKRMGELAYEARYRQKRMKQNEIAYEVKKTYVSLVFAERMLDILKEGKTYLSKIGSTLEDLLAEESEQVTEIDEYEFHIAEAEFEVRQQEALAARDLLRAALKQLVGLSEDTPFHLAGKSMKKDPGDDRELVDLLPVMRENRPDFKALKASLRLTEQRRKLEFAKFFPDFVFGFDWKNVYSPTMDDIKHPYLSDPYNSNGYVAYLGVQYVFDLPLQLARYDQSTARYEKERETRLLLEEKMDLQLKQAFLDWKKQTASLDALKKAKRSGKKWIVSEMLSYSAGLLETGDVIKALKNYFSSQFAYFDGVYKHNVALAKLNMLLGEKVQKFEESTQATEFRKDRSNANNQLNR